MVNDAADPQSANKELRRLLKSAIDKAKRAARDDREWRSTGIDTLAEYAIDHARAALSMLRDADGEALEDARYVLRWLRRKGLREFARRDAHRHGVGRFGGDPERLDAALEMLADRGWIRPVTPGSKDGPGRPASPRYAVNPATWPRRESPLGLELPEGFAVEGGQFSGVL